MAFHSCLSFHMNSTFVFFPTYEDNLTNILVTVYWICNLLSVRAVFTPLTLLIQEDEGLSVCFVMFNFFFHHFMVFIINRLLHPLGEENKLLQRSLKLYKKNPISIHLFNLALLHRSQKQPLKQVQWICAQKQLLFIFFLKY